MKKFITNVLLFGLLGIIIPIGIILLLPATPRSKASFLFAALDKNLSLKVTKTPRLILIGGSNLSFGINSKTIQDSLGLNPINTAIHAGIGLMYMLDHTSKYLKEGDIVVVVPEYDQYYNNFAYGEQELLRTVFDVSRFEDIRILRIDQIINISPYILNYIFSKIEKAEYGKIKDHPIYARSSFNKFGDVYTHWHLPKYKVKAYKALKGEINYDVINELELYQEILAKKRVKLFISFPGYQSTSFDNSKNQINAVEKALLTRNFNILGTPNRYKIADTLIYNTPYHLSKKGLDHRTSLLIEDLRATLKNIQKL